MSNPNENADSTAVWRRREQLLEAFEAAWQRGERPALEDYLPPDAASRPAALFELARAALEWRLRQGEVVTAEEYLAGYPELAVDQTLAHGLRAAESELRGCQVATPPESASGGVRECANDTPISPRQQNGAGPLLQPLAGSPVNDRWPCVAGYEILDELGRGGMGVVYKARQVGLSREVALKMVRDATLASPEELARFRGEAEAAARLQDPHIVGVFEVGSHEGLPFISMEYCPGGGLDKMLHGQPLPSRQAARLMEMLARAAQAAHEKGVVHRDLKPANILLVPSAGRESVLFHKGNVEAGRFEPKIADFGLARKIDQKRVTATGVILGTPPYMAPEQADDRIAAIGPWTDVYALGAILYELLTGRPPFLAATPMDTILQVLSDEVLPPRRLQPGLERDLETICLHCLQKNPNSRYASAQELAEDLLRFSEDRPIQARPVSQAERVVRWARRNPMIATLLSAVAVLLTITIVGLSVGLVMLNEQRKDILKRNKEVEDYAEQLAITAYPGDIQEAQRAWDSLQPEHIGQSLKRHERRNNQEDYRGFEWYHLQRLGRGPVVGAQSFSQGIIVIGLAVSPDHKLLAVSASGESIQLWDRATGDHVTTLTSDFGMSVDVAFSPDGKTLATGTLNGSVRLWDVESRKVVREIPNAHKDVTGRLAYLPTGRVLVTTGFTDGYVRFWDTETGKRLHEEKAHTNGIFSLSLSSDGHTLVTTDRDVAKALAPVGPGPYLTKVWNVNCNDLLVKLTPRYDFSGSDASYHSCLSSDGKLIVRSLRNDQKGVIEFCDASSGQQQNSWATGLGPVSGIVLSPDGRTLGTGSGSGKIRFWDMQTGRLLATHQASPQYLNAGLFVTNDLAILGSEDGSVRQYAVPPRDSGFSILVEDSSVNHLQFSPDGSRLATGSPGAQEMWDTKTWQRIGRAKTLPSRPWVFAFTSDGKNLAQLMGQTVVIRSNDFKEEIQRLPASDMELSCLAVDPKGRYVAAGGTKAKVHLWDLKNSSSYDITPSAPLTKLANLSSGGGFEALSFSPDGGSLAVAAEKHGIWLYNLKNEKWGHHLFGHMGAIRHVQFNPDGTLLGSVSSDGTARLWDVASGKEIAVLRHPSDAHCISFSPDGKRVATTSMNFVKLWEVPSGRDICAFTQVRDQVVGQVAFSPDGRMLATGGTTPDPEKEKRAVIQVWFGPD